MLNNLRYQEKSGIVFSTNIAFIFNVLLENDFINRLRKQFFSQNVVISYDQKCC